MSLSGVDLMLSHLNTKDLVIPELRVGLNLQVVVKGPGGEIRKMESNQAVSYSFFDSFTLLLGLRF